jgi:hypothetical protein
VQVGPDTTTTMRHFILAGAQQLHDLHTKLDLAHPRGSANQLHKCIVSHASGRAVFDGNVKVNRYAQKTDAGQLSRNLLLVPRATVNVKPNLQVRRRLPRSCAPATPCLLCVATPSPPPLARTTAHAGSVGGHPPHCCPPPLSPTPHNQPPKRAQIVADDVKCTHGCAISDLSAEELFYFRWRRGCPPPWLLVLLLTLLLNPSNVRDRH